MKKADTEDSTEVSCVYSCVGPSGTHCSICV